MERISKAEQIRRLYEEGWKVGDIARKLNIRYQHAYNVVSEHLRRKQWAAQKQIVVSLQEVAATRQK